MKCVNRRLALLFAFGFLAFAGPAAAGAAQLPLLLKEVEQKYTKASTLEAEFIQINESAAIKKKTTTSGIIRVKRPNKVRWETLKPLTEMSLLISDGKKFWYYTPPFDEGEHGQVIERKSSQAHSRLAQALLSGSFSAAKDMTIKEEGSFKFVMIPKKGSAGSVKKAQIFIDEKSKLISKVVLDHEGGNQSEISLSKIELGKDLGNEYFSFSPPPNTDRVRE